MRYKKDNTRRIGGLLLDLLMLSFIISFSLSDVKIADSFTADELTIQTTPADYIVVRDFDSIFGSFLKYTTPAVPEKSQSPGAIFDFPKIQDPARVVITKTQCLYKTIYTNTTINAP